jgi:hypothetical protein
MEPSLALIVVVGKLARAALKTLGWRWGVYRGKGRPGSAYQKAMGCVWGWLQGALGRGPGMEFWVQMVYGVEEQWSR